MGRTTQKECVWTLFLIETQGRIIQQLHRKHSGAALSDSLPHEISEEVLSRLFPKLAHQEVSWALCFWFDILPRAIFERCFSTFNNRPSRFVDVQSVIGRNASPVSTLLMASLDYFLWNVFKVRWKTRAPTFTRDTEILFWHVWGFFERLECLTRFLQSVLSNIWLLTFHLVNTSLFQEQTELRSLAGGVFVQEKRPEWRWPPRDQKVQFHRGPNDRVDFDALFSETSLVGCRGLLDL